MMILKLAWRNLWRNRKRTFITSASVVFAVLLAIFLNSLKEGILQKMQENVVSFYSGAIQLHQDGYWDDQTINNTFEVSETLSKKMVEHENVTSVIPRLESFALTASEEKARGSLIISIDPSKERLITRIDQKIVAGEFINENDQAALITIGLANYLELDVKDTIVIIGQGYHGASAAGKYPIKGIIDFASPQLNKSMVYLPLKEGQWLFGATNRLSALVIQVNNINRSEETAAELDKLVENEYEVLDWSTLLPELDQIIEGERAENVIFLFVLYLLISFGIFGTILMMTIERKFEFGVLVAIGMKKLKLSSVVVLENIFVSLMGAFVGTLLSIPLVGYFNAYPIRVTGELKEAYENYGFDPVFYFSIEPKIFYSQTLVVLIIALVLSIYPMLKINRLDAVNAMRD
ncbi:FtsX-like permease family protein [Ekhidna sp.]|uniref:ABC transporter permease n=1 Tax=Ekhidna sp. TaxID=2608089 RepID=UPI0032976587